MMNHLPVIPHVMPCATCATMFATTSVYAEDLNWCPACQPDRSFLRGWRHAVFGAPACLAGDRRYYQGYHEGAR